MKRERRLELMRRARERWERADAAPRLHHELPNLARLSFKIVESPGADDEEALAHVRRVPVETAPALFELPCHRKGCHGGGHDITEIVLRALRKTCGSFEGSSTCPGQVDSEECGRELRYVAHASFAEPNTEEADIGPNSQDWRSAS